ncbi:MAG: SMC-Scp complex subunit ScpB [Schwartzia sp. (in: firmicutes)]
MGLMCLPDLLGPLEAVLFASGSPVSEKQLAEILEVDRENVVELLALEKERLARRQSGIELQEVAGGWQFVTRAAYFPYIENLSQTVDRRLSPAAMETLAIIAFRQPVTKQEIEHIRGVHAEKVLALLIERELIQEVGRKAVIGRPILYGTTATFLRCFGLRDLKELPALPELTIEADEGLSRLTMPNEESTL